MKYLIIFMSHHGTTKEIAMNMASNLGMEKTTLVDLGTDDLPDLNSFDTIIIGGSIHAGQIQMKIKKFCASHQNLLMNKRVGLFICGMEAAELQQEFDNAFPQWLRDHAISHGLFGGELLLDRMSFFEKAMVKGIYGIKQNLHQVNHGAISSFEKTMAEGVGMKI